MKFHSSVLFVSDIRSATSFYTEFLEQKIEHDFGKNIVLECGLSLWEVVPDHIISQKLHTGDASVHRIELCFEEEDIDTLYHKLKKEQVQFLHEIQEEPWGQRTIRFFDPDNHLIEIGEPMDVFVKNMKKKGMTQKQIAHKSGIPIETVRILLQNNQK